MPWLPMYFNQKDLKNLSDWLNNENDISLIKSVGKGKWQAFSDFNITTPGRHCLFYASAGPLPLLAKNHDDPDGEISNPFDGWEENRPGADSKSPYFGAGHPGIIWLNVQPRKNNIIAMSSFEWIGNHYAQIDCPAPDTVKKWWNRLRRWVKKQSFRIPRNGPLDGSNKEIYAFSNAMQEFKSGVNRDDNP